MSQSNARVSNAIQCGTTCKTKTAPAGTVFVSSLAVNCPLPAGSLQLRCFGGFLDCVGVYGYLASLFTTGFENPLDAAVRAFTRMHCGPNKG